MTEQSKTVTLFAPEWQAICIGSANQLAGFFGSTAGLTDEHLAAIDTHIERLRTFARAWRAVSPAPPNPNPLDARANFPAMTSEPPSPQPNGADLSPRTGKPKRAYNRKPKPEAQPTQ